jgi:hypothetical protein
MEEEVMSMLRIKALTDPRLRLVVCIAYLDDCEQED